MLPVLQWSSPAKSGRHTGARFFFPPTADKSIAANHMLTGNFVGTWKTTANRPGTKTTQPPNTSHRKRYSQLDGGTLRAAENNEDKDDPKHDPWPKRNEHAQNQSGSSTKPSKQVQRGSSCCRKSSPTGLFPHPRMKEILERGIVNNQLQNVAIALSRERRCRHGETGTPEKRIRRSRLSKTPASP